MNGPAPYEDEVLAALRTVGHRNVSVVLIGGWRAGRATYLVTTSEGERLKARRHQGRRRGSRAAEFTGALGDPGFPAPLAVVDRVVIEAWVPGPVVTERRVDRVVIDDAAALLGRLHAVTSLPGHRIRTQHSLTAVRQRTDRYLDDLRVVGVVDRRDGRRIEGLVSGLPAAASRGLTHGDFCGENLVAARRGLVCVDNEAVGLGYLDEDVARTWCRWPLPSWGWTRFRAGVARASGRTRDPGADRAWQAVAAVRGAQKWTRARGTTGDEGLRPLHRLLADAARA